jgi:hypothetical protein
MVRRALRVLRSLRHRRRCRQLRQWRRCRRRRARRDWLERRWRDSPGNLWRADRSDRHRHPDRGEQPLPSMRQEVDRDRPVVRGNSVPGVCRRRRPVIGPETTIDSECTVCPSRGPRRRQQGQGGEGQHSSRHLGSPLRIVVEAQPTIAPRRSLVAGQSRSTRFSNRARCPTAPTSGSLVEPDRTDVRGSIVPR